MITVVIPTLNAAPGLVPTLSALVPAVVNGLIKEVIISDGGSSDDTAAIADAAGATFVACERGRGQQLAAGAAQARGEWLLFLHADTVLEPGWDRDVAAFIERVEAGIREPSAAAFRFAVDDTGSMPRMLEALVRTRCTLFRLPYGDQGLLLPRALYAQIGGFKPMPLMEDVDLVRRLGRRRIAMLRSRAITSATRFRKTGYPRRMSRNLACLALYFAGVSPARIEKIYTTA